MKKILKPIILLFIIALILNANVSVYAVDSYSEFNSLIAYKTGDIPISVYIILLIVSLLGIFALMPRRKKRTKRKEIDKHTPKRLK